MGLYGGFAGTETAKGQRNWNTNVTILDGNEQGSVVTSPEGARSTTVIDGFTTRGGSGNWVGVFRCGGGIYCQDSSPTITNNTITDNTAGWGGGGIYCEDSSPTIRNNTITGNRASYGGGIYCYQSSPTIRNNTVAGNTAGDGGGVWCGYSSSPIIAGNTIATNTVRGTYGGGIYCYRSSLLIADNAITGNECSHFGGGIYGRDSSAVVTDNEIAGNNAIYGGAMSFADSSAVITYNSVAENGARLYGGGIYSNRSALTMSHNTITENNAESGGGMLSFSSISTITHNRISRNTARGGNGGGIYYSKGVATFANNLIAENSAHYGGGIMCYDSFPGITNNTIIGNSASYGGGIVWYRYLDWTRHSAPKLSNTVVSFNSSGIYYGEYRGFGRRWTGTATIRSNDIYGNSEYDYSGLSPGSGDICLDPLFVDAPAGDYHLLPDSPCIDAGTNEGAPSTDMDGNPRPVDGDCDGLAVTDIGAYEYQPIRVQVDVLPGDDANVIRLNPKRLVPVAILSDDAFDARWIDPMSVLFGPGRAAEVHGRGHWEDVNRDGLVDLLLHFSCGASGIGPGDEIVTLYGRLINGERIVGSDTIRVIAR